MLYEKKNPSLACGILMIYECKRSAVSNIKPPNIIIMRDVRQSRYLSRYLVNSFNDQLKIPKYKNAVDTPPNIRADKTSGYPRDGKIRYSDCGLLDNEILESQNSTVADSEMPSLESLAPVRLR